MKTDRIWQGVRLRQTMASTDPDAPSRPVRLPAAWDDAAAAAVSALAPGTARVSLPTLAQAWILPIALRAREAGLAGLPERLHALLLRRQGGADRRGMARHAGRGAGLRAQPARFP